VACILQEGLASIPQELIMESDFKLQHQAPVPTISMRFHASARELPERFSQVFAALEKYLSQQGVSPAGPPFAIYHGFGSSNLDVEAGFPVERSLPGTTEIQASTLPEATIATCIYTGPYRTAGVAYSALSSWMHGQGLTAAGPFTESYLNDPEATPEGDLRTRLTVPVETVEVV
jgi:effector-binding domain-containing protein